MDVGDYQGVEWFTRGKYGLSGDAVVYQGIA